MPSVFWCCWLGGRKGIRPVFYRCWHGYLSGVRCILAYGLADAIDTHCLLLIKSRLVLPFWYRLTRVVPDKGPLNGCVCLVYNTHTKPFNGLLSRTTRLGWYQKKHSPTHTHPDHQTSFINFLLLLRSIASSLFNLCAWQSFSTTSLQVLFGFPLGLGPSLYYILHTFLHPIIIFFSQHKPIQTQPVLL